MKRSKILIALLLADFVALNVWAVYRVGLAGILEAAFATPGNVLLTVDLCLALSLACGWMWRDAAARGRSAAPWVALTVATGSAGPLAYLLARPSSATARA